tara:strand:- start:164 stop:292 length:129 start_codon:yes stop_codon:yes gene_type:complete
VQLFRPGANRAKEMFIKKRAMKKFKNQKNKVRKKGSSEKSNR